MEERIKQFIRILSEAPFLDSKTGIQYITKDTLIKKGYFVEDIIRMLQNFGKEKIIVAIVKDFSDCLTKKSKIEEIFFGKDKRKLIAFKLNREKLDKYLKGNCFDLKNRIEFDPQTKVIVCGEKRYGIKSKSKNDLLNILWEKRKIIVGNNANVITKKGEPFPKSALAVQIGIIDSAIKFDRKAKKVLKDDQTQLNRNFRKYSFPIRLKSFGDGYLLVETQY